MSGTDRFWSKVEKTDGCWVWRGARFNGGYGHFKFEGRSQAAHRVALVLTGSPAPFDGAVARHHCDNPACVRPDHLAWGTASDNMQDAIKRGRFSWKQLSARHEALRARRFETCCANCDKTISLPLSKQVYSKHYCSKRCANAGLAAATHCHAGHEFTPANTYTPPGSNRRVCRVCCADRARSYRKRKTDEETGWYITYWGLRNA